MLNASATDLLERLNRGETTALELARGCLDAIERQDEQIHAFLYIDREQVEQAAADVDRRRAAGDKVGRLAGLPVAVKDLICQQGVPTTCGSKMLANYRPPFDATVVSRLHSADAVIVGRVNMDEFAMGSSTENSAFGLTRNPWDPQRIPGGSSGGSAASVAARMVPWSLGSDTGGSIRQPAALCGVVGLKPTYGRVSRYGLVAFASSLDQIGPMANTAEDAALLLETIAGHDSLDSTSAAVPCPAYSQTVGQPLQGMKLGVVREHFSESLDREISKAVQEAIGVYESLGATVRDIELPHSRYGIATYYVIAPSEASSNLARYDGAHYGYRTPEKEMQAAMAEERRQRTKAGQSDDEADSPLVRMYSQTRAEGFGAEVKRRIMLGTYALSSGYYDAYYLKALKVRRLIRDDYENAFQAVDMVIGPVTATTAFPLGAKSNDPLAMYLEDLYTVTANLAGIPAISIPCGFSRERLPLAFQLQAPWFEEDRLLRAARMYQGETDWHTRSPELP